MEPLNISPTRYPIEMPLASNMRKDKAIALSLNKRTPLEKTDELFKTINFTQGHTEICLIGKNIEPRSESGYSVNYPTSDEDEDDNELQELLKEQEQDLDTKQVVESHLTITIIENKEAMAQNKEAGAQNKEAVAQNKEAVVEQSSAREEFATTGIFVEKKSVLFSEDYKIFTVDYGKIDPNRIDAKEKELSVKEAVFHQELAVTFIENVAIPVFQENGDTAFINVQPENSDHQRYVEKGDVAYKKGDVLHVPGRLKEMMRQRGGKIKDCTRSGNGKEIDHNNLETLSDADLNFIKSAVDRFPKIISDINAFLNKVKTSESGSPSKEVKETTSKNTHTISFFGDHAKIRKRMREEQTQSAEFEQALVKLVHVIEKAFMEAYYNQQNYDREYRERKKEEETQNKLDQIKQDYIKASIKKSEILESLILGR